MKKHVRLIGMQFLRTLQLSTMRTGKLFFRATLGVPFILSIFMGCKGSEEENGNEPEEKGVKNSETKEEKDRTEPKSDTLTSEELKQRFSEEVRERWNIRYPIYRAYHYLDEEGEHYFVMTERAYEPEDEPPGDHPSPFNDSIKGHKFRMGPEGLEKEWDLRDFKLKENEVSEEYSIWFWTKYCQFEDPDEDGRIEPIIVYGTSGLNYTSDGRIKILVYDEGEKHAIRHQNSTLDGGRNTRIEEKFSELPKGIRSQVLKLMDEMEEDDNAIFTDRPKG